MSFAPTQAASSPTTSPVVVHDCPAVPDSAMHFARVDLSDGSDILTDPHVLGCHSAGTTLDFDDLVFRSCSIAYTPPLAFARALPALQAELACSSLTLASLPPLNFDYDALAAARIDAASTTSVPGAQLPPLQPGAGIYTSPFTLNVTRGIDATQSVIREALRALQMPFHEDAQKFKVRRTRGVVLLPVDDAPVFAVRNPLTSLSCPSFAQFRAAAYFTSGYARFSVRTWRRSGSACDNYAVEVMRERVRLHAVSSFLHPASLLGYIQS